MEAALAEGLAAGLLCCPGFPELENVDHYIPSTRDSSSGTGSHPNLQMAAACLKTRAINSSVPF